MKNKFIASVGKRFKSRTLSNGLKVVAYKDSSSPEVLMQVAYNVGSANENSKTRGMAHLVEHMIFKGTEKLSESDLDAIARKYGAQYNAFTCQDKTCFYFEVDSSNWKNILPILADCMGNARFDKEHLASEIKAVIQELNMYKDDISSTIFESSCSRLFPSDHPYHFPIIGFLSSLSQLRSEDLVAFYKENYGTNNATLYIAGDIDLDQALDFAQQTFDGVTQKASVISQIVTPLLVKPLSYSDSVIYTDVKAPVESFIWRLGSMYQPLLEECSGAINSAFSRGLASRLYKKLVNNLQVATDVSGAVNSMALGGFYQINVTALDQASLKRCRSVIKKEFENPKIKATELKKFVKKELFDFYQAIESTQEVVNKLIFSPFSDPQETFDYQGRLQSLTCSMVDEFMHQNYSSDTVSSVLVLPFKDDRQKMTWVDNTKIEHNQEAATLSNFRRVAPIEEPRMAHVMPEPVSIKFDFPKPDINQTLSNGVQLIFKRKAGIPIAHLAMGFKNDEFLSHSRQGLIFNLATNCLVEENSLFSQTQILEGFEKYGADFSFNKTSFYMASMANVFNDVLKHWIKVVCNPIFSQESVDKVASIVVDNLNRESDELNSLSTRAMFCSLFQDDEFNWTFDQAVELMMQSKAEFVEQVYFKNFTPSNLVFVVVGDLNDADFQKIKAELETVSSSGVPTVAYLPVENKNFDVQTPLAIKALKDQSLVTFVRRSGYNATSPEIAAISLLNTIAFKSIGSRLYALRERYGLFYSSSGGFASGLEVLKGIDRIKVLTSQENIDQTIVLLDQMLKELAENGVLQSELVQAKQMCQKQLIEGYSSNSGIADSFLNVVTKGLGFDFHENFYKKVVDITTGDVNKIAKELCRSISSFKKITIGR